MRVLKQAVPQPAPLKAFNVLMTPLMILSGTFSTKAKQLKNDPLERVIKASMLSLPSGCVQQTTHSKCTNSPLDPERLIWSLNLMVHSENTTLSTYSRHCYYQQNLLCFCRSALLQDPADESVSNMVDVCLVLQSSGGRRTAHKPTVRLVIQCQNSVFYLLIFINH